MSGPSTIRGQRLLWMYHTSPVDPERPNGRRWPTRVDARLVERIAEEFVPDIETEAIADFVRGEYIETVVADAIRGYNGRPLSEGDPAVDVKALTAAVLAGLRKAIE